MQLELTFTDTSGSEVTFKTETNELNNAQMFTFDNWRHCYASTKKEVNRIVKDLKRSNELAK